MDPPLCSSRACLHTAFITFSVPVMCIRPVNVPLAQCAAPHPPGLGQKTQASWCRALALGTGRGGGGSDPGSCIRRDEGGGRGAPPVVVSRSNTSVGTPLLANFPVPAHPSVRLPGGSPHASVRIPYDLGHRWYTNVWVPDLLNPLDPDVVVKKTRNLQREIFPLSLVPP